MKNFSFVVILLLLTVNTITQTWTEPVNISSMNGVNHSPGFTIDSEGSLHCVWAHVLNTEYSIIYYAKSQNNGAIWTTPDNISLNSEKRLINPNIVTDSEGKIYVTYDYNMNDPVHSKILMKIYDSNQWSLADTISGSMLNCSRNLLAIDHNDRIYCFWNHGVQYGDYYYRYFENGIWSETYHPYSSNFTFIKIVIDFENDLHVLGGHADNGGYIDYVNYDYQLNQWSKITPISNKTTAIGLDMDIDNNNYPHIAWRQKTNNLPNPYEDDSTLYRFFNGIEWTEPELVTEDPFGQKIQVINNKAYIIEAEKTPNGAGNIIMYEKNGAGNWIGEFVIYIIGSPQRFLKYSNVLHFLYTAKPDDDNLNIYYINKIVDTITSVEDKRFTLKSLEIFPNPFTETVNIGFSLIKESYVILRIHSFDGKLIKTIYEGNLAPGNFKHYWDGKNDSGAIVEKGAYLVRLVAGKNIISRSVIFMK